MDPLLREKLLDLLINIISIILGGGIILLIIELRRHRRERRVWAREDQILEIDIPRAEASVVKWQIREDMSAEEKLSIYENQLEGMVKQLVVVAQFVIRNTTGAEIVVTSYDARLLQVPPGPDIKNFYDLETADLISVQDVGAIKLQPYGAIARTVVIQSYFGPPRKLEEVPSTLVVEARTSSGATIQGRATLSIVPRFPDVKSYKGLYHLKQYVEKIRAEAEEIPF